MRKSAIHTFIPLILFILAPKAFTQNLVPNPSFEEYTICPDLTSQIDRANPWFQPSQGTPDYINSCSSYPLSVPDNFWGFETAHTGNGYAGIFACWKDYDSIYVNYREYLEVKLNSPLSSGETYYISFYVSLADSMNYGTDAIQVCLSSDTLKNYTGYFLSQIPQVQNTNGNFLVNKSGWTKIFGSYLAVGGEMFLTIGNFKDYHNTDIIGVSGGSSNTGQSDWFGGYYFVDDICVTNDSLYAENWTGIDTFTNNACKIYPNPVSNYLYMESSGGTSNFWISNTYGQIVFEDLLSPNLSGIDISYLPNGIYYLHYSNSLVSKFIINH